MLLLACGGDESTGGGTADAVAETETSVALDATSLDTRDSAPEEADSGHVFGEFGAP
jgi:hypothetical protein